MNKEMVELIQDFIFENDDCSYDHHGHCQAHNLDDKPCPHERAKKMLAEMTCVCGHKKEEHSSDDDSTECNNIGASSLECSCLKFAYNYRPTVPVRNVLSLIKHHVENQPEAFQTTALEIAAQLDKDGQVDLGLYILALYDLIPTWVPMGE